MIQAEVPCLVAQGPGPAPYLCPTRTNPGISNRMTRYPSSTPYPVPDGFLRDLIAFAEITQAQASDAVHVEATTLRKWLTAVTAKTHRDPPWAAVELLRRMLVAGEIAPHRRLSFPKP